MLVLLRFLSLFLLTCVILIVVSQFAPFLAEPLLVVSIIALMICFYFVIRLEIKNFKKRKG
ncbi:hypothetical protein HOO54_14700 [Bacillus sp. WMMC1349]|uniref:hypothetical protein n=1 Tax=Bacillus sp. WMMC1349 TaxID=2736254 RepID=UPI0015536CDD|nr:hypothetical protein [Bacillus sp. WMMC1349]NPC93449.1 hypothetical protein [Bacillus sp. WMMC1349]